MSMITSLSILASDAGIDAIEINSGSRKSETSHSFSLSFYSDGQLLMPLEATQRLNQHQDLVRGVLTFLQSGVLSKHTVSQPCLVDTHTGELITLEFSPFGSDERPFSFVTTLSGTAYALSELEMLGSTQTHVVYTARDGNVVLRAVALQGKDGQTLHAPFDATNHENGVIEWLRNIIAREHKEMGLHDRVNGELALSLHNQCLTLRQQYTCESLERIEKTPLSLQDNAAPVKVVKPMFVEGATTRVRFEWNPRDVTMPKDGSLRWYVYTFGPKGNYFEIEAKTKARILNALAPIAQREIEQHAPHWKDSNGISGYVTLNTAQNTLMFELNMHTKLDKVIQDAYLIQENILHEPQHDESLEPEYPSCSF